MNRSLTFYTQRPIKSLPPAGTGSQSTQKPMNIMKTKLSPSRIRRSVCAAAVLAWLWLAAPPAQAQITADDVRNMMGSRIEAATILGGDFGVSGASINSVSGDNKLSISKFGGSGDIGDPMPLGETGIGWQPRLQGSMGTLSSQQYTFPSANPNLQGAKMTYESFAIQFGGGARFWFDDHLSLAPTIMGMYGHTYNNFIIRNSAITPAQVQAAKDAGLVDWYADTWTIRPAMNIQYVYTWRRTIITLSSDPTYFHTESFHTSNPDLDVNGNSWTFQNKIDVDVPLKKNLFGHELRTGGYFSRTEFTGDIKDGLGGNDHLYEVHGRLVLDYLNQLWKVKWIGIGGSYLWGRTFDGYSFGVDVAFRF
jgi:hypothetical protein